MYKITIDNETLVAFDYAVTNLNQVKTLYIRLEDKQVVGYKVNDKSYAIKKIEG